MSFILDALRKSENERRRSAVPGIAQIPLAVRRAALPIWAVSIIVLLGVAVLALAAAWWRSTLHSAPTSAAAVTSVPLELPPPAVANPAATTARTPPVSRTSPTAPPAPGAAAPGAAAPVDTAKDDRLATASTASHIAAITAPPDAVASSPATSPGPPAQDSVAASLPSAIALAAEGVVVPTLRLELHAYSNVPAERYVFINGSKYSEGQRLAEGPEVVAIVPKGVVLSAQGRRFLLTPD